MRSSPAARRGVVSLLVAIGAALAALACTGPRGAAELGPAGDVRATAIERGDFQRTLLLTGELEAVRSIEIKSPQTSIFQMRIQFMAEEGALVERGQPLLGFDDSSLSDQVRQLETQILDAETQIVSKRSELASRLKDLEIEVAEREYELGRARLEAAVDAEVLSEKEHAERQLALAKAREELDETRTRIELTRKRGRTELDVLTTNRDKLKKDLLSARDSLELLSIEAPADGLVVYKRRDGTTLRFQEGDSCWPGQGIISLPDLSEMQVLFHVNEVDAPLLDVGTEVTVQLDAFPGRELTGRIAQIPSMAVKLDDQSKIAVFKVVAGLSETWVGEMKPGMSARGTVVVDRREDVLLARREQVVHEDGRYHVVSPDGARVPVHPVARDARHYVLSEEDEPRLASAGLVVSDGRSG